MRTLLADRERRGLTYRELAAESGVARDTLSWWAWKLRKEEAAVPSFVELVTEPHAVLGSLELEFSMGCVLHVPAGFDADHLRRLLGVLKTC